MHLMEKKTGFVYIWLDTSNGMFYIGSHWGDPSDRYICSSTRMLDAYAIRPEAFRRRIIATVSDRAELLAEEYRWLSMIPDDQLGKKYYNLHKRTNHWHGIDKSLKTVGERIGKALLGRKNGPRSEETIEKIRAAQIGKYVAPEIGQKISAAKKGKPGRPLTDEQKAQLSEKQKGKPKDPEAVAKMTATMKAKYEGGWNPNKGVPKSAESIEKVRETVNRQYAEGRVSHMLGKTHTEEARRKISEANLARDPASRGFDKDSRHSEESKQRMRDGLAKARAEGRGRKHWHRDNVRLDPDWVLVELPPEEPTELALSMLTKPFKQFPKELTHGLVLELYLDHGATKATEMLASEFPKVTKGLVVRALRRMGMEPREELQWTPQEEREMAVDYVNGMTIDELRSKYGATHRQDIVPSLKRGGVQWLDQAA